MNTSASSFHTVIVVILTYNQKTTTLECLDSLLGNENMPFKVLVWDNGSRDGTIEAVNKAFPDVLTHYSESNLGVAGGRNEAAQLAIHEFGATHILFLDNDILVERHNKAQAVAIFLGAQSEQLGIGRQRFHVRCPSPASGARHCLVLKPQMMPRMNEVNKAS